VAAEEVDDEVGVDDEVEVDDVEENVTSHVIT